MEELSFLDKIKILFDNILAHPLFTLLIFVPIIIYFLQKKHGKKVYIILYLLVILSILFTFGDVIFKLFDNLVDGLFMVLYFPNFITLFGVVILTSIFTLISIFSRKMYKVNKIINFVSFGIIQSLFVLVLLTIRANKINVYKTNALYTNSDVLSLMQLLVGMFALQIISILIISLVNKVAYLLDKKHGIISDGDQKQINSLIKNRLVKPVKINNDKIGFINVADTKSTSKPKLKPFKFDINKIESIGLEVEDVPKLYSVITLKNNVFSYLNEVIKLRKFKPIKLNSDKMKSIKLNGRLKDKLPFNKVSLQNRIFSYLNEVIRPRKFKPIKLDSDKMKSIKLNGRLKDKLPFNKIVLADKDVTYLNEIVKPKKLKKTSLDLNKTQNISLEVPEKAKKPFNKVTLLNKDATYLNEIVKPKKFRKTNLDLNKTQNISLEVPEKAKKPVNKVPLLNKYVTYLNEIIRPKKFKKTDLDIDKIHNVSLEVSEDNNKFIKDGLYKNEFDNVINSKPDLLKPMVPVYTSQVVNKETRSKTIDNLDIIDMQSTLDVVSKYKLVKTKIKGFDNVLTVDKLNIINFNLLMKVLKLYKLYK